MFRKVGSAISVMVLSPGMLLFSSGKWLQIFRTISGAFIFRVRQSYLKIQPLWLVETTVISHGVTSKVWCKTVCLSWNSCIRPSFRRNLVELASVGRGKLITCYCSMIVTKNGLDLSQLDFIPLVVLQRYVNCERRCVFQKVYLEITISDLLARIGRFVYLFDVYRAVHRGTVL
jgi:hypothetical protein